MSLDFTSLWLSYLSLWFTGHYVIIIITWFTDGLGGEMRERPGDISLLQWRGGGVHYVDICDCHPLTLSSVWSLVESGSECLEEAEAGKRRKFKSVLPDVDNCFSVLYSEWGN